MTIDASTTALVFPAAGSHWPGMADDVDPALVDRAEAALGELGVAAGALHTLLAGEGQVKRSRVDGQWQWSGDYALCTAAQCVVSVAHGQRFVERFGPPATMVGESLGEIPAYVIAGAMSLEDAVRTLYHYAHALIAASAKAEDLRLALLVKVEREQLEALCAPHRAEVVIYESMNQFVVALPHAELNGMEQTVRQARGRLLVSMQPCAAHDARLAHHASVWRPYRRWLESVPMNEASIDIMSAIEPGLVLRSVDELRDNLFLTCSRVVYWAEAISRLFWFPEQREIQTLVQVCSKGDAVVLERLRKPQGVVIEGVRIESVATLEQIDALAPAR